MARLAMQSALAEKRGKRLFVQGIDGIGDSLHQRAPIRRILERGDELWLTTATPCLYHDFPRDRLHLVDSGSALRTQAKNAEREAWRFVPMPYGLRPDASFRAHYDSASVASHGSVLAAMCASYGVPADEADFRLPVPREWTERTPIPGAPFIVFRPPTTRREWTGNAPRNPDASAYREIFEAIRSGYLVVSVADLKDGEEQLAGDAVDADVVYHHGELDLEQLVALTCAAEFAFAPAGMMTVLAQAVETPCITVFGGYEGAASFSGGARWAQWLSIEPIRPCACWQRDHDCDKTIDLAAATRRARTFVDALN